MKSKKQKKGGANTNPLFTGFGINDVNKLLEILFLIGFFLIIILLVILGPRRLLQIPRRLLQTSLDSSSELMEQFIRPFSDEEPIIGEDGYQTPSHTSDDEQEGSPYINRTTLTQRIPPITPPQHHNV